MTERRRRTQNQRAQIFLAHKGVCAICELRIQPSEKWHLDHEAALEISADDSDDNLRPVHEACHKAKSAGDKAAIAKSNRVRAKHLTGRGKARKGKPMPGCRDSKFKHTMDGTPDGTWINRETGEIIR